MIWKSSVKKENQSAEFKNMTAVKVKKEKLDEEADQSSAIPNKKKKERSPSSSSNTESEDSSDSTSSSSSSASSSSSSSHTRSHKKKKKNKQKRNKYRDLEGNLYGQYNKFAAGQKSDRKDKVLKETTAGFKPYVKSGSSTTKG